MADFFSALGRSRALETIAGVQERAFQTSLEGIQSGSDLLKTGMEIETFVQKREIHELGIAEAKAEAAKRDSDAAFNAKVISVDAITSQFEQSLPGSSELISQSLVDFGLAREGPGGILTTTIGELKRGQELLEGNVDLQKKLIDNSVTKLQGLITATQTEIAEEIEKNGVGTDKEKKLREKLGSFISAQSSIVEFAAKEEIKADTKEGEEKPELTHAQALKRISAIGTAKVRLKDGLESGSDTWIALLDEDLQAKIRAGSINADEAVNTAIAQLDREEQFLREEFLGETPEEVDEEGVPVGSELVDPPEFSDGLPVFVTPDGRKFVKE